MDITPYVEGLKRDLSAAADAAGPEGRAVAERMALALEPAVRLTLLEALSQAAAAITAELPEGVVEVRLRDRTPELVVDVPSTPKVTPPMPPPPPAAPDEGDLDPDEDGSIARITLRLPEAVKARAEQLAARSGSSLNSWMVTVLRNATSGRGSELLDVSSVPSDQLGRSGRRLTGWI